MNGNVEKKMILGVALLVWVGIGARAQGKLPTISAFELGYSVRSWTMNDGLKDSYIHGFAQSRDGALLFSDSAGVVRYNGISFTDLIESAPPEVPRRRIIDIHEDPDGRLWTVGLSGQAMREPDGRWIAMGGDRGGHGGVGKFARGPDGRLWCAVSSGAGLILSVYEEGRFRPVPEHPLRTGYVQELMFDSKGQLWLSVAAQGSGPSVYRLEGDTLLPEVAKECRMGVLFRKDDDPRLWLVTRTGIRVREEDSWREVVEFSDELQERNGFSACVVDREGNYWIATRSLGICVCQPDGRVSRLVSAEFKFPVFVADIFTGRDGTIWFNGENGLFQLRRRPFTLWPQPQPHRGAALRGMAEDGEGTLWFGGLGNYSLRDGEFVRAHWEDATVVPEVYGIAGRREGGAWFTLFGGGLGTVTQEVQQMVAQPPGGGGKVRDLVEYDGQVWLARARDLLWLENGKLVAAPPEEAAQDQPRCLALGPEGDLFVGFQSKGLFRRRDDTWSFAGLDGPVEELAAAPDNTLWARRGTSELCWLRDGQWLRANAVEMGIIPQFRLVCSQEGSIWFQGLTGPVMRINRKAAEAWLQGDRGADLQIRTYGRAEGLPVEQVTSGSGPRTLMEDSHGRIWVATVLGTCAWMPSYETWSAAEKSREQPLPVLIEKVLLDDEPVVPESGAVTLTPDQHRIEIQYAGLDLASPESVSYRYRIEGYQEEWVDVENRHTAYFQRMPPGSYRFQVIAADRHGVWNEAGATLGITVLPHWWEHFLFRMGAPIVFVIVLTGLAYLRVRSIRRRALEDARLHDEFSRGLIKAQESERARLAGELHDDLGQDLLVMKSRIDLTRRKLTMENAPQALHQLSQSAAEVMRKVRGLSHELRPFHLDHLGLSSSILKLARDLSNASQLDIETDIDDMEGAFSKEAELAVYRVLQELLNNVVKHANAKSVKIELKRHDTAATLVVEDDGRGFETGKPQDVERSTGQGIQTMSERCRLIGASFHVDSSPGAGTLIRIEIPLPVNP